MNLIRMAITILFLFFVSCSESPKYSDTQLWRIAKKAEPSIELVRIPNNQPERRILCRDYGPECVQGSGRRIKVRMVELIAIEFKSQEAAKKEAKRIDQYYARNWVFDNVTGEPVLIDFVTSIFDAKRPLAEKKKDTKESSEDKLFYFF